MESGELLTQIVLTEGQLKSAIRQMQNALGETKKLKEALSKQIESKGN